MNLLLVRVRPASKVKRKNRLLTRLN